MQRERVHEKLFTAADVARYCDVDLKTIHNWADRGQIRHFRTPGRHLRVRHVDLVDFLRRYGYPLPQSLQLEAARVALFGGSAAALGALQQELGADFEVSIHTDWLQGCLHIGAQPPDVVVMVDTEQPYHGTALARLLQSHPVTRQVRCIIYGRSRPDDHPNASASIHAWIDPPSIIKLRSTIVSLLGSSKHTH